MPKQIIMNQLLEALKQNKVDLIGMFLSTNQEIFLFAATKWTENPLVVALKYQVTSGVIEMIAKQFPEFVAGKSKDGLTTLHLACKNNDKAMVDVLLKMDPKLCLIKDGKSMIPIQAAAKKGYDPDIIRALITACPESIQKMTSKRETVLHLAVKNYRCNAFLVLAKECSKLKLEYLLNRQDRQGNTILHIATSNKLIMIVRLLLPPRSSGGVNLVQVNTLNKEGLTALDLYYSCSEREITTREIGDILREAGAVEGCSLPTISRLRSSLETKNIILVALGIVAATVFTTVCNLPNAFQKDSPEKDAVLNAIDVLSGHAPLILYVMVFNTTLVMICIGATIVLLWSFPFRSVVIFVTFTMAITYALMVHGVMPKFFVRIGRDHDILSSALVGVLAAAIVCFAAAIHYTAKYIILRFAKLPV